MPGALSKKSGTTFKRKHERVMGDGVGRPEEGSRQERRLLAKQIEKAILAHPCGPCDACCTVKQIAEINKPEYVRCEHLKPEDHARANGSCKIYAKRPQACRDYFCAWRYGVLGDNQRYRPDRIGLVFDIAEAPPPGVLMVAVREVAPGKIEENMGALNELVAARGYVLYLIRGDQRHFMGPEEKVRACQEWSRRHLPLAAR